MSQKYILGIETSCDDTSVAVLKGDPTSGQAPEVLAFELFSQEQMLAQWGGVVPEIASRNHLDKLAPLLDVTIKKAGVTLSDIDLVGVTTFPGLLGPLLTGLNAAKTISLLKKVDIFAVNHLFAHLEAVHLTHEVTYPYIGLLVSGGHSLYTLVRASDDVEVLGSTIDDAAGEAYDKGGKLMGLGYPAGRIIDDLAKEGDINRFEFPVGLKTSKDCNLSFSGVKTALRTFLEKNPDYYVKSPEDINQDTKDICASYQHAIVSALKLKLRYAIEKAGELGHKNLPVVVGGGVACNSYLRKVLKEKYKNVFFVEPKYCTDNGAMIANYALRNYESRIKYPATLSIDARSRFINKKEHRKT
ncbi:MULTISPECIES: tRNA (adenosine(37)-N6)-threonylcarbamoyltransferase complex transferase subunit TsaD [Halobacteriovorax]|uniref:tRNA N6-adenosine threonylcarbamoyltransferase n=1 Tax=Halobacteriovorax vibrionivorans TaxID=2152716 RepID=A0ABY0IFN6_9BACT|nr:MULTISPECIES: tRNA (adenosine(37)-N6)-threonylcarbamoyltransferase complex transferase subunit TsaD [Halobacteriovorax]RZF21748.1 tRNA (adenosine(37)-N6)-threonylcarbamoyltransferase complex transferase subunit TsaD [Halobacteriovorax vibrionivorans]TGD45873.1 tRNA (adenosine(37)-N6)-threonylcarbamoyltransferase complex transferase subunit TsaD [Halobacteriovorax sp. Y22]